jgi:hypothetical protein
VSAGSGFGGPRWLAKLQPVQLAVSREMRLARTYRHATYKRDLGHLLLPISSGALAARELLDALDDLMGDLPTPAGPRTDPTG